MTPCHLEKTSPMTEFRYGIFLRPDPSTCWNITQITDALRAQFGLISAGAFAPHATLIGNLSTGGSISELVEALNPVFAKAAPYPVYNSGVVRAIEHGKATYQYNINLDRDAREPNAPLNAVANAVKEAVLPLSKPVEHLFSTPVADYEFAGHLGLASHELMVDSHLEREVGEFIAQLPVAPAPASFAACWYTLFQFTSSAWDEHWWETLRWRHLHSWRAGG